MKLSFEKDNKHCKSQLVALRVGTLGGCDGGGRQRLQPPCLTDRLSDCDGHLSARRRRERRRSAGHRRLCPFTNIFLGRADGAEFPPHASFLPPSAIPALPPQRAAASFVTRRLIAAKNSPNEKKKNREEEAVKEPEAFCRYRPVQHTSRLAGSATKAFTSLQRKNWLRPASPPNLCFPSQPPKKDSTKQISVLSGRTVPHHREGKREDEQPEKPPSVQA